MAVYRTNTNELTQIADAIRDGFGDQTLTPVFPGGFADAIRDIATMCDVVIQEQYQTDLFLLEESPDPTSGPEDGVFEFKIPAYSQFWICSLNSELINKFLNHELFVSDLVGATFEYTEYGTYTSYNDNTVYYLIFNVYNNLTIGDIIGGSSVWKSVPGEQENANRVYTLDEQWVCTAYPNTVTGNVLLRNDNKIMFYLKNNSGPNGWISVARAHLVWSSIANQGENTGQLTLTLNTGDTVFCQGELL